MFTIGETRIVEPLVELKPVAGLHKKLFAPLAVMETESPKQTLGELGLTLIVNVGLTLTTKFKVLTHPLLPVP